MQVSLHYYNGIVINVSDTRQNYSILFQNCSGSTDVLDMLLRSNIFIWTPVQKTTSHAWFNIKTSSNFLTKRLVTLRYKEKKRKKV